MTRCTHQFKQTLLPVLRKCSRGMYNILCGDITHLISSLAARCTISGVSRLTAPSWSPFPHTSHAQPLRSLLKSGSSLKDGRLLNDMVLRSDPNPVCKCPAIEDSRSMVGVEEMNYSTISTPESSEFYVPTENAGSASRNHFLSKTSS
jgi:hypothetical protein